MPFHLTWGSSCVEEFPMAKESRGLAVNDGERCRTDARMIRRETVQSEPFFANTG
jgi:hypothetical protein